MYVPGVGEVPISVSGDPEGEELVQTIREVGNVSAALRRLEPGDIIGIRGPFGTAWPVEEARGNDVLVLAGGLGMAPVRPILYHVLHRRDAYGRVALLYGTREEPDLLFRRELERWRSDLTLEILVTLDHATPSWRGHVGVVTSLVPKASFDPQSVTAYVCGPEAMMRFGARALREADVPAESIFLSLERNMKCGIGLCGHCQIAPFFVCKDGPVTSLDRAERWLHRREV
jgi:NAD(P)H-flavin reductase